MSSNSSAAKNKRQEEKYVQMIRDLASLPMNKQCFDCNSKGPTYVDVTVGSFVCTTCSGLLRGLNPPHRVKSINMSTFTQDEVEFMRNHGNQLNKMIYLSLYDANAGFSPDPKDTERFKEFLSQKYERKRWYAEPTEAMRQKVKAEMEASLDKSGHTSKPTSSLPHSQSITNSIKSPPEPASTVSSATNRTTRMSSVPSSQQQQPAPMLVFDAPVTTTTTTTTVTPSSTSLFDSFLTTSPTQKTTSPTNNFFPDQPFGSTAAVSSSNDANWGAFVEPTKPTTTISSPLTTTTINPTVMPSNNFAHPPPEPADKYAALSELFSSQNTIQDHHHHHQPTSTSSIFGNTSNGAGAGGAHSSTMTNSLFGQSPFSSSLPTPTSNPSANKFPSTNLFAAPTFPSNSNPFVQATPFGTNPSNLFPMPTNNNPPNPFLNIAQQPSAQPLANQFGKPRANSTNPFL